ncbi:GNAT family N-acetyltransferase [Bacillus sonorensis]|uniref:GNAT family N-acetyltransferase n=2 Tax=Bacillus sonorensis TaxID=119858 RepID=UPI001F2BDD75|nr:GNAT family N-acetyltransferase [Bacillus sonorensis]MCF7616684.1 GNAT family N-acetyltransferase [Bacillus sonorensis]MCY7857391.1 GNAT family N-acetyltransferase [Bacillus sonorensis]MCY8033732.1 GNAT family N-acetyltransferase [Bacillus sonorensis]MCY8562418.1 GNAT family N-acetyltransferase [Bacillus sonorensis]MEC1500238.1 GNAT family N-acetyltransferase [Bacillus sonorensis]
MSTYFLQTERLGFSLWAKADLHLAKALWGNADVTRYISADGKWTEKEVKDRLLKEIAQYQNHGVQYCPIFEAKQNVFIGCCGLRPYDLENGVYEFGCHLVRSMWGKGYASEAAMAMIDYACKDIKANKLFAGHHPQNSASRKLLERLGFQYTHDEYYPPTGLHHPSYELKQPPAQ